MPNNYTVLHETVRTPNGGEGLRGTPGRRAVHKKKKYTRVGLIPVTPILILAITGDVATAVAFVAVCFAVGAAAASSATSTERRAVHRSRFTAIPGKMTRPVAPVAHDSTTHDCTWNKTILISVYLPRTTCVHRTCGQTSHVTRGLTTVSPENGILLWNGGEKKKKKITSPCGKVRDHSLRKQPFSADGSLCWKSRAPAVRPAVMWPFDAGFGVKG